MSVSCTFTANLVKSQTDPLHSHPVTTADLCSSSRTNHELVGLLDWMQRERSIGNPLIAYPQAMPEDSILRQLFDAAIDARDELAYTAKNTKVGAAFLSYSGEIYAHGNRHRLAPKVKKCAEDRALEKGSLAEGDQFRIAAVFITSNNGYIQLCDRCHNDTLSYALSHEELRTTGEEPEATEELIDARSEMIPVFLGDETDGLVLATTLNHMVAERAFCDDIRNVNLSDDVVRLPAL